MIARHACLRRALVAGAGAVALLLCLAASAHAAASFTSCTSGVAEIEVNGGGPDAISTDASKPDVVTVNGTDHACAARNAILITNPNDNQNDVTYTGNEPWAVKVDLGGGADTFTANGIQPVSVDGGTGSDTLTGGAGADTLTGGIGNDTLNGGAGADLLEPGTGTGTSNGGSEIDTVSYSASPPAPALTVRVVANLATDSADVGADAQSIPGVENVVGGDAGDLLIGDDLVNDLDGGLGDDTLIGAGGGDLLVGGGDTDTASYGTSSQGVTVKLDQKPNDGAGGGAEGDNLLLIENVEGSGGPDRLEGNQADNTLLGLGGDDEIIGGGGNDTLDGGQDNDTVSYDDRVAGEGVTVNLNVAGGGKGETDVLSNFERIRGGGGSDRLTGGAGDDVIWGGAGADVLTGNAGGDALFGEDGADELSGGIGRDALNGGAGDDRIDGGADQDEFDAGPGNDELNAFDGTAETITCGADSDHVDIDVSDTIAADCESSLVLGVVPPPLPPDTRPRDRDNDGVFAGVDCNDLDPNLRPGAPDIFGNGIDENCDGVDAPFPRVGSELRWGFAAALRGTRVRLLELRKVPAGTVIEVRCVSSKQHPRCVFASRNRTITRPRARVSLRGYFGDRPLGAGSRIEVRLTSPQTVGRVISFTMRADKKSPPPVNRCLPPGATNPVACP